MRAYHPATCRECGYVSDRVWWVGVLVVCILCLKFGIQTAHGTSHWWTSGRDVDLLSDVVELFHILAGLVWFTSSLVTCRKQYNNTCEWLACFISWLGSCGLPPHLLHAGSNTTAYARIDLLHILAGLVGFTSPLVTCRKQCKSRTQARFVGG